MRIIISAVLIASALALPAWAQDDAHDHGGGIFQGLDLDLAFGAGETRWDAEGWIGTETRKLKLFSDGRHDDNGFDEARGFAVYSQAVVEFWDVQAGLRRDFTGTVRTAAVLGVEGTAPYHIETRLHGFWGEAGELGAELRLSTELALTQKWVLEPEVEVTALARDLPDEHRFAGPEKGEAALTLRYDLTPALSPNLSIRHERHLGRTAREGGDEAQGGVFAGVSLRF